MSVDAAAEPAALSEVVKKVIQVSFSRIQSSAPAELRSFSESVSETANKSIALLRAIDQTFDWLKLLRDRATADASFAAKMVGIAKNCERVKPFDSDGSLCSQLLDAEQSLERLHELLVTKRLAGESAGDLAGEHKDAIVDAYTEAIASISDVHNSIATLRWAIGEHDADLEPLPPEPPISSPKELEAFLKAL